MGIGKRPVHSTVIIENNQPLIRDNDRSNSFIFIADFLIRYINATQPAIAADTIQTNNRFVRRVKDWL